MSRKFSIQKHEAVDLHYVFRLETRDGIRSWAVPRGPSPDPRVKRLAFPVNDDRTLDFEGSISEGAATDRIIVWDQGEYEPYVLDGEPMSVTQSLAEGKLEFYLHGAKLQGGYSLVQIDHADDRWMLMKIPDDKATSRRNPVVSQPLSVVSGRDIQDIND